MSVGLTMLLTDKPRCAKERSDCANLGPLRSAVLGCIALQSLQGAPREGIEIAQAASAAQRNLGPPRTKPLEKREKVSIFTYLYIH